MLVRLHQTDWTSHGRGSTVTWGPVTDSAHTRRRRGAPSQSGGLKCHHADSGGRSPVISWETVTCDQLIGEWWVRDSRHSRVGCDGLQRVSPVALHCAWPTSGQTPGQWAASQPSTRKRRLRLHHAKHLETRYWSLSSTTYRWTVGCSSASPVCS